MFVQIALVVFAAQEPGTPSAAAQSAPARSPFEIDPALRQALAPDEDSGEAGAFTPLADAPVMPVMRVRGVVKMRERSKPAAILEVEGVGRYTVREGERVSFSLAGKSSRALAVRARPQDGPRRGSEASAAAPAAPAPAVRQQIPIVLRVLEIANDGVIVEVGTLGERMIIR